MSIAILLPIHKKYSDLILNNEKKLELRKTLPKDTWENSYTVYLYETKNTGCGKIVGNFIMNSRVLIDPNAPYYRRVEYEKESCLTWEEISQYCNGKVIQGWRVRKPKRFDTPLTLADFGLTHAPQSWCYVEDKEVNET